MAPFRSKAQRNFMYAHYPAIADKWAKEYGEGTNLPDKARRKVQKFKKLHSKKVYEIKTIKRRV